MRIRRTLNPSLEIEGILLTMYDERTTLSRQVATDLRSFFGAQVFQSVIPRNVGWRKHQVSENQSFSTIFIAKGRRATRNSPRRSLPMTRNALGRGLGALIREPEPQVPAPADASPSRSASRNHQQQRCRRCRASTRNSPRGAAANRHRFDRTQSLPTTHAIPRRSARRIGTIHSIQWNHPAIGCSSDRQPFSTDCRRTSLASCAAGRADQSLRYRSAGARTSWLWK